MKKNETVKHNVSMATKLLLAVCVFGGLFGCREKQKEELFIEDNSFPFQITIYTDTSGKSDTIIRGDLRKAVIYMFGEQEKLYKQVSAAEELLQTLNCGSVKNDSMYVEYLSARKKWWLSRGWDMSKLNDTCCCK